MAGKRYEPDEIVAKLRPVEVLRSTYPIGAADSSRWFQFRACETAPYSAASASGSTAVP